MSYGNRGYIIVAIFGLIAFSSILTASLMTWHHPPTESEVKPKASAERYKAMIAAGGATGNYAAYPEVYAHSCYASENHDSADLCAQWRAALAAEKATDVSETSMLVAIIGTVLSVLSTIFVVIALVKTQEANDLSRQQFETARADAEEMARLADEANKQSREHFEKDRRPYVFLESVGDCIFTEENGQKSIIWNFALTNHGRTPAVLDSLDAVLCKGRDEPANPRFTREPWGADNILGPGLSKFYKRRLDGKVTANSTFWLVTQLRYRNSGDTHFETDTQLKYHKGIVTFENEKRSYRT